MDSLDFSTRLCGVCDSLDIDQISRPDNFRGHSFYKSLEAFQESASLSSCDLCAMIDRELTRQYTVEKILRYAQTPLSVRLTNRQAPIRSLA